MRNGKRLGLFAITALLASAGCDGRASGILDTLAPAPINPATIVPWPSQSSVPSPVDT